MIIVNIKLISAEQGFHTSLTSSCRRIESTDGFLSPPPPELESSLENWQLVYRDLQDVRSCFSSRLTPKKVTNCSGDQTMAVKEHLNKWLDSGDSNWRPIRDSLISIANQLIHPSEEVHVLLDFQDTKLSHLPWQEWNIFQKHYPKAEVLLRLKGAGNEIMSSPDCLKIRILLVVGRSDGINTQSDLRIIQELEEKGAEVISLIQPSVKDLCEALWDKKGYHIFIFTGHSVSQEDGQIGWIELNKQESLSIGHFKNAFKQVIDNGLQLAIFNSCDGLGLAYQLAQLNLPRCIVMREPIPDPVAVDFLKYFFEEFTCNKSFFASVHIARKRLEYFNSTYPGAMWLPTICIRQSVLEKPLTWQGLYKRNNPFSLIKKAIDKGGKPSVVAIAIAGVSLAIVGLTIMHTNITKGTDRLAQNTSVLTPPNLLSQGETKLVDVSAPKMNILYGGSTSFASIRPRLEWYEKKTTTPERLDEYIMQTHPDFRLSYKKPPSGIKEGSLTGIKMLLEGELSFSLSSQKLHDKDKEKAKANGFSLRQKEVAIDGLAIFVNNNLSIPGLTLSQLKGIYTGRITNWSQVGGPNLEIKPLSRDPKSGGTPDFFQEEVLGNGASFAPLVKPYVQNTTDSLRQVGKTRGGIGYATASEVCNQKTVGIKAIPIATNEGQSYKSPCDGDQVNQEVFSRGTYPITRRLFVIVKENGSDDQKAGEAYVKLLLTDEGQKLIAKSGLLPLRRVP